MNLVINDEIHLSEFLASDQEACLTHLQEREISERTLRIPFPYSERDFHAWMEIVQKTTQEQGRPVHWAIRDSDGRLIGAVGFSEFQLGTSHRAQIGYWLARPYWGRGVMTAVVRRACKIAFDEFGLTKLTAHVFAGHAASARVLEKCGFQQEGYLRKHYLKDGQFLDALVFGLLRLPSA
jgi:[ribosomal protein S5]-alanine N-acetyltransferase